MTGIQKSNELILYRVYDAPVKAVWDAWTDTKKVGQWWGPRGFTTTTHDKDLRVGGHWSYTMHGPDGTDYENKTNYLEVEKYSRLVYDHGGNDDRPPLFRVTVTFSESQNRTTMTMIMAFESAEAAEQSKKFIKQAGGGATWDRLAEYLLKESSNQEVFFINRSFDAPPELLFNVWTNPALVEKWLPPKGFSMNFINADIRPGGSSFYKMISDDGSVEMFGKINYLEITPPHQILYTQSFSDKLGNMSRHPFAPLWPESMHTEINFSKEDDLKTRITIKWTPSPDSNPEEIAAFVAERPGMSQGWTGSFDKLEDFLKSQM